MEELPQWKPGDLPRFPHKLLNEALNLVVEFYKEHIRRDADAGRLTPPDYWLTVRGLLIAAMQTYASICLLLADKRPKPLMLQANVLNRALFELVSTIIALTEDPERRAQVLIQESYKQLAVRLRYLTHRFGHDPKWSEYLDVYRKGMAIVAQNMRLTPEEVSDPDGMAEAEWPTPGVMIYGRSSRKIPRFVSGSRHAVLKQVYEEHYPHQSAQAHARAASGAIAMLVNDPSLQWNPGYGESDIVSTALLFMACILTEIEASGSYEAHPKLAELWGYLREMDDEAKELWQVRYEGLVRARCGA